MPNKPKLFGMDGIRRVAGEYPLDRTTIVTLPIAECGKRSAIEGALRFSIRGQNRSRG
jgi:hypothetical protein